MLANCVLKYLKLKAPTCWSYVKITKLVYEHNAPPPSENCVQYTKACTRERYGCTFADVAQLAAPYL